MVLADRMGCLKGGVVANVVMPTAVHSEICAVPAERLVKEQEVIGLAMN